MGNNTHIRVHGRRGLSELLAMLVLAVFALGWLGLDVHETHRLAEVARERGDGMAFARWMTVAHEFAQEDMAAHQARLANNERIVITPADLVTAGLMPVWRGTPIAGIGDLEMGIIDDGTGVAMAWAVLRPHDPTAMGLARDFTEGTERAGLTGIEIIPDGVVTSAHEAAIAVSRGRALAAGDILATADTAIAVDPSVVYRRAQPGFAGATRLGATLSFHETAGLVGVARLDAETITAEGLVRVAGTASVTGTLGGDSLTTDTMTATNVAATAAAITTATMRDLIVGTSLSAGGADLTGLTTGAVSVTMAAQDTRPGTLAAGSVAAGGLFGPDLTVSGQISVGSCEGC